MRSRIKGITITLYERTEVGKDALGDAVYTLNPVAVENVLISPASDQEVTDSLSLYGKKAKYTLSIPKGDAHNWRDAEVDLFGFRFRSIGAGLELIEDMVPLGWNKKVILELIDEQQGDMIGG